MVAVGCTKEYFRCWSEYNEGLVERGTILSDLSWITTFHDDLERMNRGKRGRPFLYTDRMIAYLGGLASALGMRYRSLEGHLRAILEAVGIRVPDFSTIWRRILSMDLSGCPPDGRGVVAAVDSTGIRVGVRGEWMREKWKVRKGWVKLHILTDVRTNRILSYVITDERTGDSGQLLTLVDQAVASGHSLVKVLADGAYDTRANWKGMRERGIEYVTNIRCNASERFKGCSARGLAVRERDAVGDEIWKKNKGYSMRWKVESAISDLKRMFGDNVRSRTMANMVREMELKINMFNMMKGL